MERSGMRGYRPDCAFALRASADKSLHTGCAQLRVDMPIRRVTAAPTLRHCERSEAIRHFSAETAWIASSQALLAMTVERLPRAIRRSAHAWPHRAALGHRG